MDFQLDRDEFLLAGLRVGFLALDPFFQNTVRFISVLDAVNGAYHLLFDTIFGALAGMGEGRRVGNAGERDQVLQFGPEIDLDEYAVITEVGLSAAQRETDVDILDAECILEDFGKFLDFGSAGNLQLELGDGSVLDDGRSHGHEGTDCGNFELVFRH